MQDYFKSKVEALVKEFVDRMKPIFKEAQSFQKEKEQELQDVQKEKEQLKTMQDDAQKHETLEIERLKEEQKKCANLQGILAKETEEQRDLNGKLEKSINKQHENEKISESIKNSAESDQRKRDALKLEYEKKLNSLKADDQRHIEREGTLNDRETRIDLREKVCSQQELKNKEEQLRLDERELDVRKSENLVKREIVRLKLKEK